MLRSGRWLDGARASGVDETGGPCEPLSWDEEGAAGPLARRMAVRRLREAYDAAAEEVKEQRLQACAITCVCACACLQFRAGNLR